MLSRPVMLICGLLLLAVICPVRGQDAQAFTVVTLGSGTTVRLAGAWEFRRRMWPDTALVYRHGSDVQEYHVLSVMDATGVRDLHRPRLRRGGPQSMPLWSGDGKAFYVWLDVDTQLVQMDVSSGSRREVAKLPIHSWSYKSDQHLDPAPVARHQKPGIVEDVEHGLIWMLVREEANDEVAFWQRRDDRGGCQLLTARMETGSMATMADKDRLPQRVRSWDLSLHRCRLYVASLPAESRNRDGPFVLQECEFSGEVVRTLPTPNGGAAALSLSPDERTLLIERAGKPNIDLPPASDVFPARLTAADYERWALQNAGFAWLDLESGEFVEGPESGRRATWFPDSHRVLVIDRWNVIAHDLIDGSSTVLLSKNSPELARDVLPQWQEAVWSADGRRLALTTYDGHCTLLLDFELHQYMRLPYVTLKCWSPVGAPFAGNSPAR